MLEPLIKNSEAKSTSKPEIEHVENEKQEWKLIGSYLRTRGLKLYAYSSSKDDLEEVKVKYSNTIHLVSDDNGMLKAIDLEAEKAVVCSSDIHFEALNYKSAAKRLMKYKHGLIKELCNLREPGNGISFW